MRFGWNVLMADQEMDVAHVARATEERGLTSLWFSEHTHVPVGYTSEADLGDGEEAVEHEFRGPDPLVALGAAAAVTERITIGTAICQVVEREPIVTAKAVASVDQISKGRLIFGVAPGWNLEEIETFGVDPADRFKILRDRIQAMKAMWAADDGIAEYHGEYVDFAPLKIGGPVPVQRPHPPVFIGGNGPRVLNRVIDYGDGWLPNQSFVGDYDDDIARVSELQRLADEAGRGPIPVKFQVGAVPEPAIVERYEEAGVDEMIVVSIFGSGQGHEFESRLDEVVGAIERL